MCFALQLRHISSFKMHVIKAVSNTYSNEKVHGVPSELDRDSMISPRVPLSLVWTC